MVVLYPTVIQPLFNKLSPLAEGDLRTRIEALASKLKFPLKHLYEIDGSKRSSHSNAYFFGLPWVTTPSLPPLCIRVLNEPYRANTSSSSTRSSSKASPRKSKLSWRTNWAIGTSCTPRRCSPFRNSTPSPYWPPSPPSCTRPPCSVPSTSPRPSPRSHPPSSRSCCSRCVSSGPRVTKYDTLRLDYV